MLFLTGPWHMTLTAAGLALTPMPVAALLLTTCVGAISDRTGFRLPMTVGTLCMTIGLVLSALVDRGTSFSGSWLPIVAFIGFGVGLCFPLLGAAAVAGQPPTRLAAATAVNQCARQIGAALGVAGSVAALGTRTSADVSGFHTAWLLCAACTAVAAVAALGITRNDAAPSRMEMLQAQEGG
jgi:MFS family permease